MITRPLPPRPTPDQVRDALALVTAHDLRAHVTAAEWQHLHWTAWNTLRIDRLYRRGGAIIPLNHHLGGDAA